MSNTPWIGSDMNVAPRANMEDGFNDIMYLTEDVGRRGLIQVLLRQDSGRHVNLAQLKYVKTTK